MLINSLDPQLSLERINKGLCFKCGEPLITHRRCKSSYHYRITKFNRSKQKLLKCNSLLCDPDDENEYCIDCRLRIVSRLDPMSIL